HWCTSDGSVGMAFVVRSLVTPRLRRDRTGTRGGLQTGLPFTSMTTTLTVLHPKGGVGRSTTVYMLGAELALRGHRVALIDRDQGQHLSRVFDFYPPAVDGLVLGEDPSAELRIVDTAPEVNAERALGYLREADWVLVPVKGPEAGSVL